MRPKQHYIFLLLLPFLLLSLWGCAATDSTSNLYPARTASATAAETDEDAPDTASEFPADEATVPEPELTAAEEIKELETLGSWEAGKPYTIEEEVSYDYPVTMNRQVEFYLDFFQNKYRDIFTRWLERSTRYLPMIKEELREAGLPEDLAYLPMIESGYSLTAFSTAKAVGPWQFMTPTAKDYSLEINSYVDERRDPEKSTKAAVAYLSDLYDMFGDWHLTVAAYNAGCGKISRGLKAYNKDDFWELAREEYLNGETKRYVPKLIAAIIIAKNPEKYGFTGINYQPPLAYETIEVPAWTSLRAVEVACNADLEELRNLNRSLPQLVTPPDQENYPLKVPVGKKELVAKNLPRVKETVTTDFKTHVVGEKETLTKICKLYDVNKTTLLKTNNLRKSSLSPGMRLRIPYQVSEYILTDKDIPAQARGNIDNRMVQHKVQPGETLSLIAKRYNVSIDLIVSWNKLSDIHHINVGQQLAIYDTDAKGAATVVTASRPETATTTAAKKEATKSAKAPSQPTFYKVQDGDTLWKIARRFDLDPGQLKQWNKLRSNVILPGTLLKVADPDTIGPLSMRDGKKSAL
ncbi:MAG: LysM peptidoglycan-binding domain-containing protein [Deltaproteobacteria bacterium]|nr:LysM peptidoglycan-binding domain-containing protein [Deltaproteobacteria bacterium]